MSEFRNSGGKFNRLLVQRRNMVEYLKVARQARKKLEEFQFVLANAKELDANFAAVERRLEQLQHILFIGNRSTNKTPLVYALNDKPLPHRQHSYDFATEINLTCQVALVDSPGMDAPDEALQAQIVPQTLLRVGSAALVVLTVGTPNTSSISKLFSLYAEHRPIELRGQDICLIWDRSGANTDGAGDAAEISETARRYGIAKVIVQTDSDLPAATEQLGNELDGDLAERLKTLLLSPQREKLATAKGAPPFLSTFFVGFLNSAQQKFSDYTPSAQNLAERIQQLETKIKRVESDATDSEAQLVTIKKQKEALLRQCRDIDSFLALVAQLNSTPEPTQAAGTDIRCVSLSMYRAAAEEMFDQGWDTFCTRVRSFAHASEGELDLLEEGDRKEYVEQAAKSARAAGNQYLASWISGELGAVPLKSPPPCLHSTLYSLVEQSYVWAQQQWKDLKLPAERAPTQTNDVHDEIQKLLVALIPRDTHDWNSAAAEILRDTILGSVGGFSAVALAAAGAKVGAPFVFIDGGLIAAIGALGALIVGFCTNLWSKGKQRKKIRLQLNQLVRNKFDKELNEYKDVGRQQFSLAGAEVYKTFESHIGGVANEYLGSLKKQVTQLDKVICFHEAQFAQAQAARAQLSALRAEHHALTQQQAELADLVKQVEAALCSLRTDGESLR